MVEGAEEVLNIYTCHRAELKLDHPFYTLLKFDNSDCTLALLLKLLFFS